MSSVDDRIVNMKFNNSQFKKNTADTISALDKLKQGLDLKDSAKNLSSLDAAGKAFSLAGIANGVDTIASKFSALSIIGITALTNIANKAVNVGIQMAKSLTIDPVKAGFDEYELKMGSIQTILSNTARYGTSLDDVVGNLDELNEYADKTIYNFGDMTKNIGLFTNAGIRIEDATSMIQGFSNEAASSGTNAQGAAAAAYQLSQALSAGTIRLMDWRSLQNVGMGNKNMQNGLIEIADAMGTLNANSTSATEIQANFNGSLEKNWLSADVMSSYLKIMAGDMTAAEQAALGLSDAQIQAFAKQQQMSEDAATKVRTYTQLIGTLREGVGSGWSETFDLIIGDFNEATDLWTSVNDTLGAMLGKTAEARNYLLSSWKDLGGRDAAIAAVSNAFQALMGILKPIQSAFKDIFPPLTAKKLVEITEAIRDFTKNLIPSEATTEKLRRTFAGVFAVLDIGWTIIKKVFGVFGQLFGAISPVGGSVLDLTAKLGDFLVKVRNAIKDGEGLGKIFEVLGKVLVKPIELIKQAGAAIINFVSIDDWAQAWENVSNALQKVWQFLKPVVDWFVNAFHTVKDVVVDAFKSMDPNLLVGVVNMGLLGGLVVIIKKFVDGVPGMFSKLGGGIFDTIKGAFGELTKTMETMQQKLKSEILVKIAIAIGILTAALVVLSFIDTDKLAISLGAITVMLGQLMGTLALFQKVTGPTSISQMNGIAAAMILMSTAMVIFASALLIMSSMDWVELARGLTAMAVGLGIMIGATKLLAKASKSMVLGSATLLIMSIALVAFAGALKIMSTFSWDDIGRSLTLLAGSLTILIIAMRQIETGVASAFALLIVANALTVLSAALLIMGKMQWDQIGRALATLAGSMLLMALFLIAIQGSVGGAFAMLIVSASLIVLSAALQQFAKMSWEEIAKALVMLAGSLLILAGGMALMGLGPVLLGSVGLMMASLALMALAPALKLLGSMSWDDIGRGLTMLAASILIMAVGGLLLIPASVGFLLLGAAILMIGTGAFLAGIGLISMSVGLAALAGVAVLGAEAIKMVVLTLIELIPAAMAAFAQGLIEFAVVIASGGAEFTAAMTVLLMSLITSIQTLAPAIVETLFMLIMLLVATLEENVPKMVDSGLKMLNGILKGIADNIQSVTENAIRIATEFIDGIASQIGSIIDSGVNLILSFIEGITDAIKKNSKRVGKAGGDLAVALIQGMADGIWAGVSTVVEAAQGMAQEALNAAMNLLGINSPSKEFFKIGGYSTEGLANGLTKTSGVVYKAGQKLGDTTLYSVKKSLSGIANAVATDMNMTPTIRPVLDLSAIRKDAGLIGGILTPPTLTVADSYEVASSFANARRETEAVIRSNEAAESEGSSTTYIQNITSPKEISEAEVYRNTRNLLSQKKK